MQDRRIQRTFIASETKRAFVQVHGPVPFQDWESLNPKAGIIEKAYDPGFLSKLDDIEILASHKTNKRNCLLHGVTITGVLRMQRLDMEVKVFMDDFSGGHVT
jgi:hypothetical protein